MWSVLDFVPHATIDDRGFQPFNAAADVSMLMPTRFCEEHEGYVAREKRTSTSTVP